MNLNYIFSNCYDLKIPLWLIQQMDNCHLYRWLLPNSSYSNGYGLLWRANPFWLYKILLVICLPKQWPNWWNWFSNKKIHQVFYKLNFSKKIINWWNIKIMILIKSLAVFSPSKESFSFSFVTFFFDSYIRKFSAFY